MRSFYYTLIMLAVFAVQSCDPVPVQQPEQPKQPTAADTFQLTLDSISEKYRVKIGVAIIGIESGDTFAVHGHDYFTMMSVVKFPQAIAILKGVDVGDYALNDELVFSDEDLERQTYSPLRDEHKDGSFKLTLAKTLEYAVGSSDNLACDKLFTLLSPSETEGLFHRLGYRDMIIGSTYAGMTDTTISRNRCTPLEMTRVLCDFFNGKLISANGTGFLKEMMLNTKNPGDRIKGKLPPGTVVVHKTGTMSVVGDIIPAFNDVGVVELPNGEHYAITVFINDSQETEATNAAIIADISLAAWRYFTRTE